MVGKRKRIRRQLRRNGKLNPLMLASCYGKIRHVKRDRKTALENRPSSVRFYKCKFCAWWHIGKLRDKKKKKRRGR